MNQNVALVLVILLLVNIEVFFEGVLKHLQYLVFAQMTHFKKAIEDMAALSLRCVALAYRTYEKERVPADEEQLSRWALPEDDLILLAIVGIKVRIPNFPYLSVDVHLQHVYTYNLNCFYLSCI